MPSSILRGGTIAQILSVLLFVFVSARVAPISVTLEANTIAPVVEDGMSMEVKVVAPLDSLDISIVLSDSQPAIVTHVGDVDVAAATLSLATRQAVLRR
jgi:hypothetical protein